MSSEDCLRKIKNNDLLVWFVSQADTSLNYLFCCRDQQTVASWIWPSACNKVLWNTAMPICLYILSVVAFALWWQGLGSWDKNRISRKPNILTFWIFKKSLWAPELAHWFCWERWDWDMSESAVVFQTTYFPCHSPNPAW